MAEFSGDDPLIGVDLLHTTTATAGVNGVLFQVGDHIRYRRLMGCLDTSSQLLITQTPRHRHRLSGGENEVIPGYRLLPRRGVIGNERCQLNTGSVPSVGGAEHGTGNPVLNLFTLLIGRGSIMKTEVPAVFLVQCSGEVIGRFLGELTRLFTQACGVDPIFVTRINNTIRGRLGGSLLALGDGVTVVKKLQVFGF